ncbi:hypothetical protein GGC65_004216 [Sphingopyxis sp. OAS728]|uniref:hypothetical protein n=1 Tax=Sphingopyxis sp. OAS728 TaxID=2663823 RepID=UPI001788F00D|nr:hypothetical protein [Sphingopyxis sp. OAS728]MBE1529760.1 hypothetical protein [Sphingopyxis sp. OAS728]
MDMNQLLYHHQIALMAADLAPEDGQQMEALNLARHYVKRMNRFRHRRGLSPDFTGYSAQ